jgi:hypothetical protein
MGDLLKLDGGVQYQVPEFGFILAKIVSLEEGIKCRIQIWI